MPAPQHQPPPPPPDTLTEHASIGSSYRTISHANAPHRTTSHHTVYHRILNDSALSRAGVSVLHVDRRSYYGGASATVGWLDLPQQQEESGGDNDRDKNDDRNDKDHDKDIPADSETPVDTPEGEPRATILAPAPSYAPPAPAPAPASLRSVFVDRMPLVLPSRGPLVELLVESRLGQHLEFKLWSRVDLYVPELAATTATSTASPTTPPPPTTKLPPRYKFMRVPRTKEDVFLHREVPLLEKRKLMRYLTQVHQQGGSGGGSDSGGGGRSGSVGDSGPDVTFQEYLAATHRLAPLLQSVVGHAIAWVSGRLDGGMFVGVHR